MHEADQGRNEETNIDDGSAMIMQHDEKYCATLNGQHCNIEQGLCNIDDGEAPF